MGYDHQQPAELAPLRNGVRIDFQTRLIHLKFSLFHSFRFEPRTQDARCSAFDPYTILAFLTFGIFLIYLFSMVFNQLAITARGRTIRGVSEKQTNMIYSCLLRGHELWGC